MLMIVEPMYQGFEYVTRFVVPLGPHGQPHGVQSIVFSADQLVPLKMLVRLRQSMRWLDHIAKYWPSGLISNAGELWSSTLEVDSEETSVKRFEVLAVRS